MPAICEQRPRNSVEGARLRVCGEKQVVIVPSATTCFSSGRPLACAPPPGSVGTGQRPAPAADRPQAQCCPSSSSRTSTKNALPHPKAGGRPVASFASRFQTERIKLVVEDGVTMLGPSVTRSGSCGSFAPRGIGGPQAVSASVKLSKAPSVRLNTIKTIKPLLPLSSADGKLGLDRCASEDTTQLESEWQVWESDSWTNESSVHSGGPPSDASDRSSNASGASLASIGTHGAVGEPLATITANPFALLPDSKSMFSGQVDEEEAASATSAPSLTDTPPRSLPFTPIAEITSPVLTLVSRSKVAQHHKSARRRGIKEV